MVFTLRLENLEAAQRTEDYMIWTKREYLRVPFKTVMVWAGKVFRKSEYNIVKKKLRKNVKEKKAAKGESNNLFKVVFQEQFHMS